MRPTKYKKRITIQTRTRDENAVGGWSNEWTTSYVCFASLQPIKGFRRLEYGQNGFTQMYEVEMRSRTTNPTIDDRILYKGVAYQIISPYNDEDRINFDIARK